MKNATTADRLRLLMVERGLRQKDIIELCAPIARKYGLTISKANLSMYVSGRVAPAQDKLLILGEALGVSEVWLMGYDVPREISAEPSGSAINETAAALFARISKNPDAFRMLLKYAKKLDELAQLQNETDGPEEV